MKHLIYHSLAIAALAVGASLNALADPPPGQVDFGKLGAPAKGGEFVEVQVNSNLLSLAARLVEKEQPDAAKLLRSVQLVRVNVVGLTDENRAEMEKHVRQIRNDLTAQGWERNVNVQSKNGEDIGVYTRTHGDEALQGLAITVIDPKDGVVLVNIVGDIKPEQVAALGEALNIKPLEKIGETMKK